MKRHLLAFGLLAVLTACGAAEPRWSPDDVVAKAHYVHDGPPAITLFTVISTKNGTGAHAGLMINGTERIMFDPAGTWYLPRLGERNDVHFGMTDKMVNFYIDYHARETYYVVEQTKVVSPEVAKLAMQKVMSYGAVPKAHCTEAISGILQDLPGFESLPHTWFPRSLMESFAELPGVTSRTITDDDADNNHGVLMLQQGDPRLKEVGLE